MNDRRQELIEEMLQTIEYINSQKATGKRHKYIRAFAKKELLNQLSVKELEELYYIINKAYGILKTKMHLPEELLQYAKDYKNEEGRKTVVTGHDKAGRKLIKETDVILFVEGFSAYLFERFPDKEGNYKRYMKDPLYIDVVDRINTIFVKFNVDATATGQVNSAIGKVFLSSFNDIIEKKHIEHETRLTLTELDFTEEDLMEIISND